jgi:hypothetical protein
MTAPNPAVVWAGVGVVSADLMNTYVQIVASYSQLRTFSGLNNMAVLALGTSIPNDGGQGHFYYNSSSTATDNNTTVIVPNGKTQGAWLRLTGI